MRKSRVALAATVLAGAAALALGVALPSLADTETHRFGALDDPASSASASAPAAPRKIEVNTYGFHTPPVLGQPFTMTVAMSQLMPAVGNEPSIPAPGGQKSYGPLPEGLEFTVTRTDLESPSGLSLGTLKTNAKGFLDLTDTPPAGGKVTYKFAFAGNAQLAATSFATSIDLARAATTLRLDKHNTVNAYGSTPTITATLGKTYKNRVVEIWARPYGLADRLVKRAAVNSAGKISLGVKLTRNTIVTAKFAGDARTAPATYRVNLWTKVNIDTKLTRHYKTAKIGSVTYQYFRKSADPLVTHTVSFWVYREVRTTIQAYQGGKWQLWSARITDLNAKGQTSFSFVTAAKAGTKFRVRAEYIRDEFDNLNYSTAGAWKYFTYTK